MNAPQPVPPAPRPDAPPSCAVCGTTVGSLYSADFGRTWVCARHRDAGMFASLTEAAE